MALPAVGDSAVPGQGSGRRGAEAAWHLLMVWILSIVSQYS